MPKSKGESDRRVMLGVKVSADVLAQFTKINKARDIPNSVAVKLWINDYIKEHEELLKECR